MHELEQEKEVLKFQLAEGDKLVKRLLTREEIMLTLITGILTEKFHYTEEQVDEVLRTLDLP